MKGHSLLILIFAGLLADMARTAAILTSLENRFIVIGVRHGFFDAVMAQRKGELLKMEMLERLASLHRDLKLEVEIAGTAKGASTSAIQVARELLGCDQCGGARPKEKPGYEVRQHLCSCPVHV